MSLLFAVAALLCGAFVHRRLLGRFGAGTVQHLVRLPGNLLHELAHAVAMLATGYNVEGFSVSLFDPAGRGQVRPGRPWIGVARPWLTNLVSPVAPAVAGIAALAGLHTWGGIPGLPTAVAGVSPLLRSIPYADWHLWVALALAFSVTAEMAPSDVDLHAWWRPAMVVALLAGLAAWGWEHLHPGSIVTHAREIDAATRGVAGRALGTAVWSGVVVAPIAWGAGKLRG